MDEDAPHDGSDVDALVAAIRADPVSAGRRLHPSVHAGADGPTDEEARALAAAYLAVLRPADEAFRIGDVPYLVGAEPRCGHTLPQDIGFPGYRPDRWPLQPNDWHFQEGADARGYLTLNAALYEMGMLRIAPARRPRGPADFTEALREPGPDAPVTLALFGDFANGLPAARYIAAQIVADPSLDDAIHLGDVYYNGTAEEFDRYLHEPLSPLHPRVPLHILAGNHDMYGKGGTFHAFLDRKRRRHPDVQRQRGHSWRLANSRLQVVGIDTQWEHNGRIPTDTWVGELLARWLRDGRAKGRFSVLCTSMHGWDFGAERPSRLYDDLRGLVKDEGLVDLWLWGNVHHAAVYRPDPRTGPFWACCVGHGGYPYERLRPEDAAGSPAPVHWAEYESRFHRWKDAVTGGPIRPDMGNNGWCRLSQRADGSVDLAFVDWIGDLRHTLTLRRGPGGVARVGLGTDLRP